MQYDIFISYKRKGTSSATAAYLYELLLKKGYNVFFDRKEMRSGNFNTQLLEHISNATDIIILLEEESLDSWFKNPHPKKDNAKGVGLLDTQEEEPYKTDWFCREVMHALSLEGKNIIPLLLNGYHMPDAKDLPQEMKELSLKNALSLEISEIEEFYQKYFIDKEYLLSKPKNLAISRQFQNKGAIVGSFLFYTEAESCELFERGNRIFTLTDDNDEDHPFEYPVTFAGEHRFRLINNDTCEERNISKRIETNCQEYVHVEWTETQNLWQLTDELIEKEEDANKLYRWGKGLFEGTAKNNPDIHLSFLSLKRSLHFGCEEAKEFFRRHGTDEDKLFYSKEAAKWYQISAELGNADAQCNLGILYTDGYGIEQDYAKAREWWLKAAEQGNADAQCNLGYLYGNGLGVEQDYSKARECYLKAAEQGNAWAQGNLGILYENGDGVEKDYSKAREWYLKAAEQGIAGAQYYLGILYEYGRGVEQDFSKAHEWYLKAAEQGHADAQCNIGNLYDNGNGVEQDHSKACEWYLKAAEQGHARAQYNLGIQYENGYGVEQDSAKAREWWLKASENGNDRAQYNLGLLYANGNTVEQDYSKAREWWLKASEQGNARAQYSLGILYENGYGVEQDYTMACEWYLKAAEQGHADAQCNLGYLYENGLGVEQDYSKAREWYLKAAEQGHVRAQCNLGYLYEIGLGVQQDYAKAGEWYLKAAEQGSAQAQYNLGLLYVNGNGVEQDYSKAREWWLKAAEQGEANAQRNLGILYANGDGVEQDYAKAYEWYLKAAEQGHADAQYNLGVMYENGDGVEQDSVKAREWWLKAGDSGNPWGYNNIAWSFHLEGKYEEALPWAEKAVEIDPDNPHIIDTLATVYQGLGRYDKALEKFELCLRLAKESNQGEDFILATEQKIADLINQLQ